MNQPWSCDFSLDVRTVSRLIARQFPEIELDSITYFQEGWDNIAFRVNSEWIFRFPKRMERRTALESEVASLKLLAGLKSPIAIPRPIYFGLPDPQYPCEFVGYRILPGITGSELKSDAVNQSKNAELLAEFLSAVHSIEAEAAASNGVMDYGFSFEEALAETVSMNDLIQCRLPHDLRPVCESFLTGECEIPGSTESPASLVHGDLTDEHILLDESGMITGVIDWGDSCVSNPIIDFSGLYLWLGKAFVESVLKHYRSSRTPPHIDHIAFHAKCCALSRFGYALQQYGEVHIGELNSLFIAFDISSQSTFGGGVPLG